MKLRHAMFSGFGLSALLLCPMAAAQAMPKAVLGQGATQPMTQSSSILGGPITPSQPDLFTNSNNLLLPTSVNSTLDNGLAGQPIPSAADKSPTPLVGDPPRPSRGGIINIKTD